MWVIGLIFNVAIPALSAYLASNDEIYKSLIANHVLSEDFDISLWKSIFLFINILFTVFALSARIAYHQNKERRYRKEIAGLYNVIKQFAQSNFASISEDKSFSFDLRIFVPEECVHRTIKNLLFSRKKEKWFVIQNIEPFAKKDITEHLRLRVEPDHQGLVGKAYNEKSIVYDDDLSKTNSTNYLLEGSQLNRTSNLLWCLCVPITNDRNEVIAVMAFDSGTSSLNISQHKNEIGTLTNTLSFMIRNSVPELFHRKWRI